MKVTSVELNTPHKLDGTTIISIDGLISPKGEYQMPDTPEQVTAILRCTDGKSYKATWCAVETLETAESNEP